MLAIAKAQVCNSGTLRALPEGTMISRRPLSEWTMRQAIDAAALISLWTLSRGEQVITCELVASSTGQSILRCGYGPNAPVRTQVISSEAAVSAVSETWKAALMLEGFRAPATPGPRAQ